MGVTKQPSRQHILTGWQPSLKIFRFDCPKGIFSEPAVAVNLPVPLTAFFFLSCWKFG